MTSSSSRACPLTLAVDTGDEERVLLVPRHEGEFAGGRHGREGQRQRPPARRRPRRRARGPAPRHRRRRPRRCRTAACSSRSTSGPIRCRSTAAPVARARVPRGGRGDPRAARRRWPHLGLPALHHRARRARRHQRLPPGPQLRAEGRAAADRRRDRAAGAGARPISASASPSCRSASGSATTSSRAPRSSSASTSCASRWTRSARSSTRTTPPSSRSTGPRSRRPACRTTPASRPRRSSAGWSGSASSRPSRA